MKRSDNHSDGANDSRSIPLAAILSAGIRIESFEAIAIIQGLCDLLLDSPDSRRPSKIYLDDVFVEAMGAVTCRARPSASGESELIQSIGGILEEILPAHDFMSLRERVVSKAISAPPFYQSFEELAQGIAYYARPNQKELISDVFRRWSDRSNHAPQVEPTPKKRVEPPARVKRQWVIAVVRRVALASILITAAAGATWAAVRYHSLIPWPWDAAAAEASANEVIDAVRGTTPAATRSTSRPPTNSAAAESAATSNSSAPTTDAPRPADEPDSTAATPVAVPEDQPVVSADAPDASAHTTDQSVAQSLTSRLYRPGDAGVTAPIVIYPQRLNPLSAGYNRETVMAVEITVNETGTVDRARVASLPRQLGESLVLANSLSATKTWRFHPATKDGRPVKYVMIVALTEQ